MARSRNAHKPVLKQRAHAQTSWGIGKVGHRQVHLTRRKNLAEPGWVWTDDAQRYARG